MTQKVGSEARNSGGSTPGTTTTTTIQISGDDGSVFPATVYTSVNVTDDPELVEPLMEGTLNEVDSPTEDGRVYRPAVPVVYHDEEREVFALIIPEALRHKEFSCRCELLNELADQQGVVPDYMRRFEVVFEPSRLERLGEESTAGPEEKTQLIENPMADSDVQRLREKVAEKEQQIEELRQQNEERLAELEEREQQIKERERKLQVRELNLEQKQLQIKKENDLAVAAAARTATDENTQVVTDSQFIEVVDVQAHRRQTTSASPQMADSEAAEATRPRRPEPTSRTITTADSEHIPDSFPDDEQRGWFVAKTSDLVVVGYSVDDEDVQMFVDGDVEFLFQLHEVHEIPLIGLTLASFGADGECLNAVTAPLVDRSERQRSILDKIARDLHVQLALYGQDGELVESWEAGGPLRRNIGWARQRLRKWRDGVDEPEMADEAAVELATGRVELVGTMRHPFDAQSFAEFDGASDVKLAASIVGYWSESEQFDYLVGNRSFPLEAFLNIQKRVVRQALHWGLAFGETLQKVAIDEAIILDKRSMVQRLLSNFAEVCVGLRANDLDPMEQWENWDILIEMAEVHGITPDPDVLELAESSLKRAEEYEEVVESGAADIPEPGVEPQIRESSDGEGGAEVEEKSYDDAGVTYFVPAGQSGEKFADLWEEDRLDVESLLEDPHLRVLAAQILVERHGSDVVGEVLDSLEEMESAEVAAVSRFCEERADELEAALMQALDSAGPAATVVAGRALAAVGSAAALPRLLDAVRHGVADDGQASLARCLARFGDKLIPPLSRALKDEPHDHGLLTVLAALEQYREGTLDEMAEERSDSLREAVERARELN